MTRIKLEIKFTEFCARTSCYKDLALKPNIYNLYDFNYLYSNFIFIINVVALIVCVVYFKLLLCHERKLHGPDRLKAWLPPIMH